MKRVRAVTVTVLSLAVVLPGSAQAAPNRIATGQGLVSAIAVHGDEVLWSAKGRLLRRGADGIVRTVRRVEQSGPVRDDGFYSSGSEVVRLEAATSTALIVERTWDELASKLGDEAMGSVAYLVDLSSGRRTTVEQCGTHGDAALAGTTVLTSGCAAPPGGGNASASVQLRDLARPEQPPRRLADAASAVRAAGRMVAWLDDRTITVMDVDSGVRREIDVAPFVPAGTETPLLWDLDVDGSVAFGSAEGVVLAAADGSPPRTLAKPGTVIRLVFAAEHVAVSVQRSSYFGSDGLHQVVTLAPDGTSRVLAGGGYTSALDADGDRLAYSSLACIPERHDLWLQRTTDAPTADVSRKAARG